MSHNVKVSGGKYEFVLTEGCRVDILRHGQKWVDNLVGVNAIHSMMSELDAARAVLQTVRGIVGSLGVVSAEAIYLQLKDALKQHEALVGDLEPPSSWTK